MVFSYLLVLMKQPDEEPPPPWGASGDVDGADGSLSVVGGGLAESGI